MGYTSAYATSSNGHYVYADITWDSNLKVTVSLTNVNAGWCVKIRGTSTIKCSGSMSNRTGTFYADYSGQEFTLQVYDLVEESYVNNGNPIFAVTNSGSGDSGSGSGGSGGGTSTSSYRFYYSAGEGTFLQVKRRWNETLGKDENVEIDSGTSIVLDDYFDVTFGALNGYENLNLELTGFRFNEHETVYHEDGKTTYRGTMNNMYGCDITVTTSATRIGGVYIDNKTSFDPYYCYIDNGKSDLETIVKNCEIVGHRSFYTRPDYSNYVYYNSNYNIDNTEYASAYYDMDYNSPINYAYVLAFKVPRYIHHPVNFTINIQASEGVGGHINEYPTMNYALCSSDFNYCMYAKTVGPLSNSGLKDVFEVAHGAFSLKDTNGIVINNVSLNPKDEIYYLFIWDDERIPYYTDECPIRFYSASQHTVTCTYVENQFDLYIPYIDNGTSWEPL
jgi:hypothetical protein